VKSTLNYAKPQPVPVESVTIELTAQEARLMLVEIRSITERYYGRQQLVMLGSSLACYEEKLTV
jgi:hypothetical protein